MKEQTIRIGVDVGGTNTDICAIDEKSGELMVYKLPSSLHDQSAAVVEGVKVIAEAYGFSGEDVSRFMHGTTVATNAILEGRGAKTALITTGGFRDLLEIGRQKRPDLYDLQADKPRTLIPRDLRYEVNERLSYKGEVVREIAPEEVERIVREIKEKGAESVVVTLLNAYLNPENEVRIKQIMEEYPANLLVDGDRAFFVDAYMSGMLTYVDLDDAEAAPVEAALVQGYWGDIKSSVSLFRDELTGEIYAIRDLTDTDGSYDYETWTPIPWDGVTGDATLCTLNMADADIVELGKIGESLVVNGLFIK